MNIRKYAIALIGTFTILQTQGQNVGIGINTPSYPLHIYNANTASIALQGNKSAIDFYEAGIAAGFIETRTDEMVFGLLGSSQKFNFRNAIDANICTISSNGLGLGTNTPQTKLHVVSTAEAIRVEGTTPYFSMYNGATVSGYLQAWTDGLAIGSNTGDVGLWTGGSKRFAIHQNGSLLINGSDGATGQVLTSQSSSSGAIWAYPTNGVYNSAVFKNASGYFAVPSINTLHDIPGLSHTFTLPSNTLVQISLNEMVQSISCFGCGNSQVFISIYVDGSLQYAWAPVIPNGTTQVVSGTIQVKLPSGAHTIKAVVNVAAGPICALSPNANLGLMFFPQ